MSEAFPLRVVVVDDSDVVRMKMRQLLVEPEFDVVGEAPDGATGLEVVGRVNPDVVVMDLQMPGMSGIDATWRLGEVAPEARVLMLTVSDDANDVADAVMAGAKGYVLKGSPDDEITDAVGQVGAGHSVISPAVAGVLVERSRGAAVAEPVPEQPVPEAKPVPAATSATTPPTLSPAPPPPVATDPTPGPPAPAPPAPAPPARSKDAGSDIPASLTAAVVLAAGVFLTALGQGQAIADGDATSGTWLRVALNFLIAFAVWRAGVLAAGRRAPSPGAATGKEKWTVHPSSNDGL